MDIQYADIVSALTQQRNDFADLCARLYAEAKALERRVAELEREGDKELEQVSDEEQADVYV